MARPAFSPRASSVALVLGLALVACSKGEPPPLRDAAPPAEAAAPKPPRDPVAEEAAHHKALADAAHALYDGGTWEGAYLGATSFVTSVLSVPLWPEDSDGGVESVRLGYLRHGSRVPVIPDPIVNESCPDGWLELVAGGFICGKNATLDPKNPRVRLAPHGPDLTKSLPYQYGVNVSNGTPLYRRVLSIDDRKKYEPWLSPPKPVAALDAGASSDEEDDALDAGAAAAPLDKPEKAERGARGKGIPDASVTPWYLRDGGSKEVTLEELHGRGVLVRRMVRGFVLALDRDFKAAHAHWWRNTAGFAVPFERVAIHYPLPEFHGAWLGGRTSPWPGDPLPDAGTPPVSFGASGGVPADASAAMLLLDGEAPDGSDDASAPALQVAVGFIRTSSAHALVIDPEKKNIAWGAPLERRSVVELTGETYAANGATYRRTTRGTWVSSYDVELATPSPPPSDLAPGEKWIDVDLTHQILVAFEGTRPVYATLVSSGKRNETDKTKDHPTPTGTFHIQSKHVSVTMDGDVAADAPYSIEDVPWVMYFDGSYALHGAFWHGNFGHPMSHGCVNLSPADARQLFGWTEPRLPAGWHGVFANAPTEGTRVVVHE